MAAVESRSDAGGAQYGAEPGRAFRIAVVSPVSPTIRIRAAIVSGSDAAAREK